MPQDKHRYLQQGRVFSLVCHVQRGRVCLAINWSNASLKLEMPYAWLLVSFTLAVTAIGTELLS